ncbi:hypothetical protein FOQG_18416 [Fusarium oxysporum f. sp. raphani 54005]|uniref:Uncharacterized protein n=1 Tax=Fusarium oxysporum f. sp. raphani 54005 TaxID=1089458 RepID=X0BDF8_FUSOX|nr:hypothetical protein FOQG_18416 [Fusarium oxysporum f. sp. raphani 54005]
MYKHLKSGPVSKPTLFSTHLRSCSGLQSRLS